MQKNTQLTTNSQESVETQVLFFIVKNPVVFTLLLKLLSIKEVFLDNPICHNKQVTITFYMTLRPQQEQYQLLGSLQNDIIATATESSMKI